MNTNVSAMSSSAATNLTWEDAVAGSFLVAFGTFGITLHAIVFGAMWQLSRDVVGFRFLMSQGLSDMLLLVQFGIWPGMVILLQSEVFPAQWRWHIHIYLDFTWWSMVYHYTLVAWSRLAAIRWPNWFRCLSLRRCVGISASAWIVGLIQTLLEHQLPWFQVLYFSPEAYGMTADWERYNREGTATYYLTVNVVCMLLPFPFYGGALAMLVRRQDGQLITPQRKITLTSVGGARCRSMSNGSNSILAQRQLSIETRLIIPCVINTLLFVIGQVFITVGSRVAAGKWMSWLVLVVFAANSFVNPLLYLTFSSVIRRQLISDWRERVQHSPPLREYDQVPSSSGSLALQQHRRRQSSHMPRHYRASSALYSPAPTASDLSRNSMPAL